MSDYEKKAEDYHINKMIKEEEIELDTKIVQNGMIGCNKYDMIKDYNELVFNLFINGKKFELDFECWHDCNSMISNLEKYERCLND